MAASERSADTDVPGVLRAVLKEAREERVGLVAAGLAYNMLLFVIPVSLLSLVALESTGNLAAAADWFNRIADQPISVKRLHRITGGERARTRAAALAVAFVLWSGIRMFRSINSVFSQVHAGSTSETWTEELLEVAVVLATSVGALVVVCAAALVVAWTATSTLWYLVFPVLLFVGFFVAFFPVYYVFPPVDVAIVDVLPGTLLVATVLTLSGLGFRLYAEASVSVDLYGMIGVALILITWLYVGGLALLVGVILNAVLADLVDSTEY